MRTRVIIVIIGLIVAAGAVARADRYDDIPLRTSFALFPMQIEEWTGVQQPPFTERVLEVLGVEDYLTRAYFRPDGAGVGLYIGYWESQRTGDTIHSPMNCLPGAGWEPVSTERVFVDDPRNPGGPQIPLNRVVILKGIERQLVYYWYQSHGRIVASEYWGKIYMVVDAVRMNRSDGAIVRVTTPIAGEGAEAERAAEATAMRFVNDLLPRLSTYLPE